MNQWVLLLILTPFVLALDPTITTVSYSSNGTETCNVQSEFLNAKIGTVISNRLGVFQGTYVRTYPVGGLCPD